MISVFCVLFFLSGAVGLIYEIVWVKALTLQFGNSAWSISTVIAAFMAGLGAGSAWSSRQADRVARPLRFYAGLELGIALFGLLSLPILNQTDLAAQALYDYFGNRFFLFSLFRFGLVGLLLFIPTFLMGATLPVLVAGASRRIDFNRSVGLLYGINTAGAAVGTALAGFLILPHLGTTGAVAIAFGLGALVCILAFVLEDAPPATPKINKSSAAHKHRFLYMGAAFISGALAIYYEVAWSRILSAVLGSSTYAFSAILTIYLLGLGLGGLIGSTRWVQRVPPFRAFAGMMVGISLLVTAGLYLMNDLPALMAFIARHSHGHLSVLFAGQGLMIMLLIFPATLLMGAMLPLLTITARTGSGADGKAVGRIYAINTAGSIIGSLLAGFVFLPKVGAHHSLLLGACLGAAAGVIYLLTVPTRPAYHNYALSGAVLALFAAVAFFAPPANLAKLNMGLFRSILATSNAQERTDLPDLLYIKDGLSSSVAVYRHSMATSLNVNGKTDASTADDLDTQYQLAHLPLFLNPTAQDVCIIGLGSGATVRAAAGHEVQKIDVVELEPAMVKASSYFTSINDHALDDPRVALHIEDGRTFLRYQNVSYDVIISEPSNPWIAGVGTLFTTEFYGMVRSRLKPGGVFAQWIQLYEISPATLAVMLQTLAGSFNHVLVLNQGSDLICVASQEPMGATYEGTQRLMEAPLIKETLGRINVRKPADMWIGYLASFPEDLARYPAEARNTDGNMWLEYRAPLEMYRGSRSEVSPLPPEEFLPRYHRLFMSDLDLTRAALDLGESLARLRSYAVFRIEGLITATPDDRTKKELELLKKKAINKNRDLEEATNLWVGANDALRNNLSQKGRILILNSLALNPEQPEALQMLGILDHRSNPEAALKHYEDALKLAPLDYISLTNIGSIYGGQGKLAQAEEVLKKAVEINPHFVSARVSLISIYTALGRSIDVQRLTNEAAFLPREVRREFEKSLAESRR